jgi:type II secretion system protein G
MYFLQIKNNQRGFTLIELLVVIAIIGMLSSVILASMNTARKKARDARRMADAKSLQTALELYYDAGNTYPVAGSPIQITESSALGALTTTYISKLPTDPTRTGANGYLYAASSPVNGYAIAIQKEVGGWCQFKESTGYSGWSYALCTQ